MATRPDYPLLTAREFLAFDFGDRKAELDNGIIRMMAGGTVRHAQVQGNVLAWLRFALRGSGCRAYGPDMALLTHDRSIRYPDVSVFCHHDGGPPDDSKAFDDPSVVFEVLSASTARTDLRVKLDEYKELPSVNTVVFVDIAVDRLRIVQRTEAYGWSDVTHQTPVDVVLPSLGVVLPHDKIFARD